MPKQKKPKNRTSKRQKRLLGAGLEFIKLQIAGNIPFWGTYIMYALLDTIFFVDPFVGLLLATIAANAVFFVVNDQWVFRSSRNRRNAKEEIWRFTIFMIFSSLLSFMITWLLYDKFGISPYIGQFITAALSIIWTFTGLKFWVFAPTPRRARV